MRKKAVRINDLLALVKKHYEMNKLRSAYTVGLYIDNQLALKLGNMIADACRKCHIDNYKENRRLEEASDCTVNRELSVLSKAFKLGLEEEIITRKPPIKLYPEPEPREGYYTPEQFARFQAYARTCADGVLIADITTLAYFSGWRLRECLRLNKSWVKLEDRLLVLPKQFSKNKRIRVYPLEGSMLDMIAGRYWKANVDGLLFHRAGREVKDIRAFCIAVCKRVGLPYEHFFHNLRRSATTNINRAGIDNETGKKITGHRTDGIYHAYNQVSVDAMREAVKKVQDYVEPPRIVPDEIKNPVDAIKIPDKQSFFQKLLDLFR